MINLKGWSTARSSAFCLQLAVNDTLRFHRTPPTSSSLIPSLSKDDSWILTPFKGPAEAVEALCAACWRGLPQARIDNGRRGLRPGRGG